MSRKSFALVAALSVVGAGSSRMEAQRVTGGVTGTVTDPSGAVLPGAKVTAHNLDTGVDSVATSDAAGLYRIQFLPIGRYGLKVDAAGFGEAQVPPFSLEALQTPTFNVKLTVGDAGTTVDVSDAAPILNTSDATISGTFTANAIQNFPLNGLDFSALTLYVPGSVSTVGTSGTQSIERSTQWTNSVNLNGNRAQANNYTLDGIDLNETFNNLIAYSPAPESLGELKVLTANSPADYGNVNGGGVVAVLKSGTNALHGSAYAYLQTYHLDANSWNNKHSGLPINPFSQNQFGGTLGGPIKRDKLFFFVDYLGSRFHQGGSGTASVFTQAMRNGDFSALLGPNNPIQLYDSQHGYAPFVNDRGVPVLNPVAKYLFAHPNLYPLPNHAPDAGTLVNNNLQGPTRNFRANNQGDIKLEYDPRPSDKLTAFYSMGTGYDGSSSVLAIAFPNGSTYPSKLGGANWVHIFSSNLVNSARVGYTRVNWTQGLPVDGTGQFGTNGDAVVGITFPGQAYQGFTSQGINGLSSVGNNAQNNGSLTDNTYSYLDNLTLQRGQHTFTMGVQALRYQNNYPTSNNNGYLGTLNYSGIFTSNPAVSTAGYGGADFLLDYVSNATANLTSLNVGQRQWRAAGFLADDWKVLPNLTLNLGVRYEYDQPWIEANNKTGNIDLATGQVLYADHVPTGAPAGSGVCSNRACYQPNYRQIMPRLGFAYQASGRFVVRGGYGATSFYEGNSSNQRLTSITPFIQAVNISAPQPTLISGGTPRTAEQGFTGGATQFGGTYNVYPQNIQPAYVQEYNLTVETALTRSLSLQVGYLGETGQHIEDYGNVNQWRVSNDPTSAPFYNSPYIGQNADPSVSVGNGQLLITESRAAMSYNALQAVLRQRLSHGLEFTANYTYSKALTNSLGNYGLNANGFSGAFQNYYDSAADWGPAGYDVPNNFSGTATYALPVGHGKQFLSGANHLLDEVIGGWRVSTAAIAYSGFAETIQGGSSGVADAGSAYFGNVARPNQYRALKIRNRTLDNWFGDDPSATICGLDHNTKQAVDNGVCAFGLATPGAFGTGRNGNTRGPRYLNVDMSAFKDFHTFREQTFGVRCDAFNAFNIASYGNPNTSVGDSNFGNVSSQTVRSQERRLQFSANYRF